MSKIVTLDEAIRDHFNDCVDAVAAKMARSVRPIYASDEDGKPDLVGSCVLVEIESRKYVVSAAHVTDWTETHGVFVSGAAGTQPVQILGSLNSTKKPAEGREKDKYDFAFWEVHPERLEELGDVRFLKESEFSSSASFAPTQRHVALGYPLSKNKDQIDHWNRKLKAVFSKYSGKVTSNPALCDELGVSGDDHLFLGYEKLGLDSTGKKVNTFSPRGMSGGALVDLGIPRGSDVLSGVAKCDGELAGVIVEKNAKHKALVCTRIDTIARVIRGHANAL
jgi:hypothetical protein